MQTLETAEITNTNRDDVEVFFIIIIEKQIPSNLKEEEVQIVVDDEEEVVSVESEEASNVRVHLSRPLKPWLLQVAKEVVEELVEEEVVEQQHPVCPICLDFLRVGDEVEAL